MTEMFAMQRANGDWFAMSEDGQLCVPIFNSNDDAIVARSRNHQMLHFKPMRLDERAIDDLQSPLTQVAATFRVISEPGLNLIRGRLIDHAQLIVLNRHGRETT